MWLGIGRTRERERQEWKDGLMANVLASLDTTRVRFLNPFCLWMGWKNEREERTKVGFVYRLRSVLLLEHRKKINK